MSQFRADLFRKAAKRFNEDLEAKRQAEEAAKKSFLNFSTSTLVVINLIMAVGLVFFVVPKAFKEQMKIDKQQIENHKLELEIYQIENKEK